MLKLYIINQEVFYINFGLTNQHKWHFLFLILGLATGISCSYFLGPLRTEHHFTERVVEREIPVIQEVVNHTNQTEVVYEPKSLINQEQIDPVTGKSATITHKETTDVDVRIGKPTVNVKLNNQPYSFFILQDEAQRFEQGKISLSQQSSIDIELAVKPQVVDRTKNGSIDVFVGRYSGIGIQYKRFGLDIGTDGSNNDVRLRWRAIEW